MKEKEEKKELSKREFLKKVYKTPVLTFLFSESIDARRNYDNRHGWDHGSNPFFPPWGS